MKTLTDLYQEYPERFASGVQSERETILAKVKDRYPDFKECFPSGVKARQVKRECPLHFVMNKFYKGRG